MQSEKTEYEHRPLSNSSKMNGIEFCVFPDHFHSSNNIQNRLYRTMRHLKDDVRRKNPTIKTPSPWLLKKLVQNFFIQFNSNSSSKNEHIRWRDLVIECLQLLNDKLTPHNGSISLFEEDGTTPLFPNNEAFSAKDTHVFIRTALAQFKHSNSLII